MNHRLLLVVLAWLAAGIGVLLVALAVAFS
jgi:hypothetical protein